MSVIDWSLEIVPKGEEHKRLFTLAQANNSLILLRRIVGEVMKEYAKLLELEELIDSAEQSDSYCRLESARQSLVQSVDVLQTCLDELDQIGVELRDFSRGIVDFPSRHDGRIINLCWLFGEEEVTHWHEYDAGFACRQPICLLKPQKIMQPTS